MNRDYDTVEQETMYRTKLATVAKDTLMSGAPYENMSEGIYISVADVLDEIQENMTISEYSSTVVGMGRAEIKSIELFNNMYEEAVETLIDIMIMRG